MRTIPEFLKVGLSACTIYDTDTPQQVVDKIENNAYAVDGRTYATEPLPDYYRKCKKNAKTPMVQRHKFF